MENGFVQLALFVLIVLVVSSLAGMFLHIRNRLHHHYSPLLILILGCTSVSLFVAGVFIVSWVFLPDNLSQLAISPGFALLSALAGTAALNWLAYGFHWAPDP